MATDSETISASYNTDNAFVILTELVNQINTIGDTLRTLSNRNSDGDNGPLVDDPVISYLKRSIRNLSN